MALGKADVFLSARRVQPLRPRKLLRVGAGSSSSEAGGGGAGARALDPRLEKRRAGVEGAAAVTASDDEPAAARALAPLLREKPLRLPLLVLGAGVERSSGSAGEDVALLW